MAAQDGLQVLMRRYNDPTEPAQVKRLTQMPQPVFSSSAPDEAVDDCKTGSSRQWRGWHAAASRSGVGVRIAP
ncbi:hypothetical protein X949_6248 [Burkholderia pseudomallei MSHR5609]|nr:hypothetical protein X949_6248 [Burkholderia pseudomallei MSHR5609]